MSFLKNCHIRGRQTIGQKWSMAFPLFWSFWYNILFSKVSNWSILLSRFRILDNCSEILSRVWNRASLTKLFGHQFNQDLSSLTIFILTWYHRFITKQGWCWFSISCLISIKDSKYFFSLPGLHISLQNCVSYVSIECRRIFVGWIDVKR